MWAILMWSSHQKNHSWHHPRIPDTLLMMSKPSSRISRTWQTGADIWWGPMQGSDTVLCHVQYFFCNLLTLLWQLRCAVCGLQVIKLFQIKGLDFRIYFTSIRTIEILFTENSFCSLMLYSVPMKNLYTAYPVDIVFMKPPATVF